MSGKTDYAGLSREELVARLMELEQAETERKRLLHDLEVHQVELGQQNVELREAQNALEASRSRYADLFDFSPVGHLVLDPRGRILQANLRAASLLGRERDRLAGRYLVEFLTDASRNTLEDLLWRNRRGNETPGLELQLSDERGLVTLGVSCREVPDPDAAQQLLHLGLVDLSAEREAQARADLFGRTTNEGIVFSRDGYITDCNRQFTRMLDYPAEALRGASIEELIAPEDRARIMENIRLGRESDQEHVMLCRDGSRIRVAAHGRPNPEGGAGRRVTIVRDVTEARRARDLLQLVTDSAPLLIAYVDREQRYRMVNTKYMDRFGKSRNQLLGCTVREVLGEGAYGKVRGHIERALAGERQDFEDWFRFPGREEGHFSVSYIPHWGEADQVSGFVAVVQDTTKGKRSEQALRESESFHRQILESIPGMVFTTRPDGWCDYQSRQWVDYTGVPMEEHLGDGWNRLLHPNDAPRAMAAWRAAVAGRAPYDLEYRVRRSDGIYQWFRVVGRPIRDEDGGIARWFGVAVNIERLKQAEQRSRHVAFLVENSQEFVGMADLQFNVTYINPAGLRMVGMDPEKAVGMPISDFLWHADRAGLENELIPRVMHDGQVETELRFHNFATGEPLWMLCAAFVLWDEMGNPTGYATVSHDITRRKQVEAERLATLERQRDTLVQEVHHRIKNHLQGVTGLLRNRADSHPEVAAILQETIAQVRTISQVYGLQSRRFDARVPLSELIEVAARSAPDEVRCRLSAEKETWLDQNEAVPVSLVVNELITNALKHRTGGDRPVQVSMEAARGRFRIQVRGGPARLPPGLDFAARQGLGTGLELVGFLLPSRGAELVLRQEGDEVVADLFLTVPVGAAPQSR